VHLIPPKGGQFHSLLFDELQNTASFEGIKTIETNQKFCNRNFFAKLNKNIREKYVLALKCTFTASKRTK